MWSAPYSSASTCGPSLRSPNAHGLRTLASARLPPPGRCDLDARRYLVHGRYHDQVQALLDPAVRERLALHYAEPNAQFAEWLGRDLSSWDPAQRSAPASNQKAEP